MKLVLFSAGTESTALLVDSVQKYGRENVIALTTIIMDGEDNRYRKHYEATEFYTKKICKQLGVEHKLSYKSKIGIGYVSFFSILQIVPDAYNLVITDRRITHLFSGVNKDDRGNTIEEAEKVSYLATGRKLFRTVMELYELDVPWQYPLCTFSKKEQYAMIPDSIKPYVWTCDSYTDMNLTDYVACQKCPKCLEFKQLVLE